VGDVARDDQKVGLDAGERAVRERDPLGLVDETLTRGEWVAPELVERELWLAWGLHGSVAW
jgi:hypothetical protein